MIFGLEKEKRISVFRLQTLHEINATGIIADHSYDNWSTKEFINTFTFSPKDNNFIDERMVLAIELGTLTDNHGCQKKYTDWSNSGVELREGLQNLVLEWDLPRK